MKRVTIAASMALGLLPWLIGCGDTQKKVYKASGVATYDNKAPLKGARLTFIPVSGKVEGEPLPHADTDDNGKFEISTYGDKDGAPAGEYKVTVAPAGMAMPKPPAPGEKSAVGPTMPTMGKVDVAPEYLAPDKTTVKVTIATGDNSKLEITVKRAAGAGS